MLSAKFQTFRNDLKCECENKCSLSTIARIWRKSRYSSKDEWLKKLWYICTMKYFVMVQSLSCVWLFATPWDATLQASLPFTISQSLLKTMSTESVMLLYHLILSRPLLLLPSVFHSIRVFSNESALCIRWPKYFGASAQHQSFQWIFRVDFL